jgi:hypothetical protein
MQGVLTLHRQILSQGTLTDLISETWDPKEIGCGRWLAAGKSLSSEPFAFELKVGP